MSKLQELKDNIRRGKVYRRADLCKWSKSVDRHLRQLIDEGTLQKLSGGLYYYPTKSTFGEVPADTKHLVKAFLNDDRFLIISPNSYNSLGMGTTQLYNKTVVYNHKRHGAFKLGGRTFDFRIIPHFPKTVTKEFLLVDLLNNLERLAEDPRTILDTLCNKSGLLAKPQMLKAIKKYASVKCRKILNKDNIFHT